MCSVDSRDDSSEEEPILSSSFLNGSHLEVLDSFNEIVSWRIWIPVLHDINCCGKHIISSIKTLLNEFVHGIKSLLRIWVSDFKTMLVLGDSIEEQS